MAHGRKISVIGLGYVGLPVAVAFGAQADAQSPVIGFDINATRIAELKAGHDRTREVDAAALKAAHVAYTSDPRDLRGADFHIVAVPTPIDSARNPDFTPLLRASETVGAQLKRGDIVVYESTVYPGATEEVCVPVLERVSKLSCGADFTVGYSPERINPGDKEHTFTRIKKVVSGQDARTLDIVADVYGSVVTAGIHRAPTIKTAEAAKVIENTQRDINIALMNELSLIFERLGIDTQDVLAASRTKWNFLPFEPGLVGGHCIGVDPYYLTYKAQEVGYHPEVILAGRRTNDIMGAHVAGQAVKRMVIQGHAMLSSPVTVLGLTFKQDIPDLRNTRMVDVIRELESYKLPVQVADPFADAAEAHEEYGITLTPLEKLAPARAVILGVPHKPYREGGWPLVQRLLAPGPSVVADVRGVLPKAQIPADCLYWRL
jgi:UDP-N-acetyl-D-glucosamine/UDP-N-acetyl-D-galactosamine dehydrogenase